MTGWHTGKLKMHMKKFRKIFTEIKIESLTLYLCCRDSRVTLYAKLPAFAAVGLFFSPIDLIPDFIPVLGHIDDIIIIPVLIKLAQRLIPAGLYNENREKALGIMGEKSPVSIITAIVIALLWIAAVFAALVFITKYSPKLRAFLHW